MVAGSMRVAKLRWGQMGDGGQSFPGDVATGPFTCTIGSTGLARPPGTPRGKPAGLMAPDDRDQVMAPAPPMCRIWRRPSCHHHISGPVSHAGIDSAQAGQGQCTATLSSSSGTLRSYFPPECTSFRAAADVMAPLWWAGGGIMPTARDLLPYERPAFSKPSTRFCIRRCFRKASRRCDY